MSPQGSLMLFTVLGIFVASGAETITGRVVNPSSDALADAKIWLKNNPGSMDSTGADGTFSLELPSTGVTPRRAVSAGNAAISLGNNRLVFSLHTAQKVRVELFTMQ